MEDKEKLLENIEKIHTTEMGIDRIKKNLDLNVENTINWCITKIKDKNCKIIKKGKNYYAEIENTIITINANSYTIITAHKSN